MKLNKLALKDKKLFERFLALTTHLLSSYTFENIYIWKDLYQIYWGIIEDSLCIFFKDSFGSFLYLPPQGKKPRPATTKECFKIMDSFNRNREISRIENVEVEDLSFYRDLGYTCQPKPGDYLYSRQELADLKGDKFKSKRATHNYFIKHYDCEYLPYSSGQKDQCLKLFELWQEARKTKNQDPLYQGMLADTRISLKRLLDDYAGLDILGRVVKIEGSVKAFTFGCQLNKNTFCILYEITDLSTKGLSQFIFRKLAQDLEYEYINVMDDSGLDNLKKLKFSYRPVKLISAYIVNRKNEPRPS